MLVHIIITDRGYQQPTTDRGKLVQALNVNCTASMLHQVQTSSEKQKILARQHGSALRPHSPSKAGAAATAAVVPAQRASIAAQQITEGEQKMRSPDVASVNINERAVIGGGGGMPHPAVLIPAVRAVAAQMAADHAAAGPLRRQYQARNPFRLAPRDRLQLS